MSEMSLMAQIHANILNIFPINPPRAVIFSVCGVIAAWFSNTLNKICKIINVCMLSHFIFFQKNVSGVD